jgi:hypothetical protein
MIFAGIHSNPFTTKSTKNTQRFPVSGARPDIVAMPLSARSAVPESRLSSCTSCSSWFKILPARWRPEAARHRPDR